MVDKITGAVVGISLAGSLAVIYGLSFEPEIIQSTPEELAFGLATVVLLQAVLLALSVYRRHQAERAAVLDDVEL